VSMQDTISDMLTRIRNAQRANHKQVTCSYSGLKHEIVKVLKDEGYIHDVEIDKDERNHPQLVIVLKYFKDKPVIESLKRISKPSIRVYTSYKDIKDVPGFGIVILSTPQGVMSHVKARALKVGGEIVCEVA